MTHNIFGELLCAAKELRKDFRLMEKLIMSVEALTAAISQLDTDVKALVASTANSVPQSEVDQATAAIVAIDAEVKAVLPAPVQ